MRKRGWSHKTPNNGMRRRLWSLNVERHPWWDWGHRLMIFTGTDMGGTWSEPEPPTWYYRMGTPTRMWRTGYPQHPLSTFEVIKDYETFRARIEGLNEDEMYEWKAMCFDQDEQLQLGHRYWGKDFYGLTRWEVPLLARYLRMARRHNWWGARRWLYSLALDAAVNQRKPFTCQATPPKGQGGYSHWHCREKRNHDGMHRFNNYVWGEIDGEEIGTFDPIAFTESAKRGAK
jgi:hypothetical protein